MLDPEPILRILTGFQRKTVEYVFRRMYLDDEPALRFLVADEVGLGKTLVARGLVAKAIEKLQREGRVGRIDVVYVCSNSAIARQNINKLNVTGEEDVAMASRLTLLPIHLRNLEKRSLNFVSFTPGTTLDLKYNPGTIDERALIFQMLRPEKAFRSSGFQKMLQCGASRERWDHCCYGKPLDFDRGLAQEYRLAVLADRELCARIDEVRHKYAFLYNNANWSLRSSRNRIVGDLRKLLAGVCIRKLEPDLVILDEFQRFKDLLGGETEASLLARQLMEYMDPASGSQARVLLLSATPYRMYTMSDEGEDHYSDFMETLRFLFDDDAQVEAVRRELEAFRCALLDRRRGDSVGMVELRHSLRERLMSVMVRTERVGFTRDRDAMLSEKEIPGEVRVGDLRQAVGLDRLSAALQAGSIVEYWKSAPYLLNFMKGYALKRKFEDLIDGSNGSAVREFRETLPHLLEEGSIEDFQPLEPGNPRLRALLERTVAEGQWALLWIPPSLPYYEPGGVYSGVPRTSKTLVFSAWNVVPDAIAAVCSYEVERRMVRSSEKDVPYRELHQKYKGFLRFPMRGDQPAGMTTLVMQYPSPFLSGLVDPLEIVRAWEGPESPRGEDLLALVMDRLRGAVETLRSFEDPTQFPDRSWHWAALAKLDGMHHPGVQKWCRKKSDGWKGQGEDPSPEGEAFPEHVDLFVARMSADMRLGSLPEDLHEVLAELALGSPAICAARALRRIAPGLSFDDPALMTASAIVANGFRSLFNNPDSQLLLRSLQGEEVPLWRAALRYAIDGNLQAVLDEYAHVLRDSLGLFSQSAEEVVLQVAGSMFEALSLRVSNLVVDELGIDEAAGRVTRNAFRMRCRFALRFSDIKDETETVLVRAGTVRDAFNSPFRPFVLASTSIGQEGLDFHTYCHAVWHWNLPSNPVDLEQREGRVNRYKGLAVRRNIAACFGIETLGKPDWDGRGDPWQMLFEKAARNRPEGMNDLYPYWIFEEIDDPCKVERTVPTLPFSRESTRLDRLKKSLALYRLAFGQPRQEDLVACLECGEEPIDPEAFRISLQP